MNHTVRIGKEITHHPTLSAAEEYLVMRVQAYRAEGARIQCYMGMWDYRIVKADGTVITCAIMEEK